MEEAPKVAAPVAFQTGRSHSRLLTKAMKRAELVEQQAKQKLEFR